MGEEEGEKDDDHEEEEEPAANHCCVFTSSSLTGEFCLSVPHSWKDLWPKKTLSGNVALTVVGKVVKVAREVEQIVSQELCMNGSWTSQVF
ncbi:hypothetical protein E2C01_016917 [Portunus trituberculatus]|uniref:Uncharacterized protein n=1 Tax=Portunus trituberculatus TaxID=210409 RepID=A0A5B7DQX1_PORTR|nr:hypothetical protein [Portunus trituberculatus]